MQVVTDRQANLLILEAFVVETLLGVSTGWRWINRYVVVLVLL